ncbi:nucleotidyltransferase family protein [Anabaena sp. UHCC 0451]|uniref:nucleotidyltransferase domain-containing protein n=1 Tax=Anabaena sp. UHCC 0451 TaxID=2055235 RepID=UPI002B1EDF03|nr:nucleotidyltransferase family protein [Anabaena sp. UHCC 0451]MEA5578912.1 nucleotidyltransferase family protein [Anabaena sp. UHCC 0451]
MSSHIVKNLYPETELILSCARTHISDGLAERIQYQIQQKIDWTYLLSTAEKHRVIPLLYHSLKVVNPQEIPSEISTNLRMRFLRNTRTNLILTNEMLRLLEIFATNNINVIPYKGTILSACFYGKTSFRQVWDIDILVDETDVSKSRELLLSEEYIIKTGYDREQTFYHPQKKVEVDLHWGLTPYYFPVNLDFKKLWSKTKYYPLSGVEVKSFCPEDLLIILCLQLAKDCWERRQHLEQLAKVCDIAELLRNCRELNWSDVITEARGLGLERILHFGLYLAKSLVEADIPEIIWTKVQGDKYAISLAYQVCSQLFGEIDNTFTNPNDNSIFDLKFRLKQLVFYLKMRERPQDWVEHFLVIFQNLFQSLKSSKNHSE